VIERPSVAMDAYSLAASDELVSKLVIAGDG
jgi:hypothetical protein